MGPMRIRKALGQNPHVRIGAAIALWMIAVTPASAQAEGQEPGEAALVATAPVALAAGRIDTSLVPIADGLARWMSQRVEQAGGTPGLGDSVRAARGGAWIAHESTGAILARSAEAGAARVLLVDLDTREGAIRITLRAYDAQSAQLLGAATRLAVAEELGVAANETLRTVLPRVGMDAQALSVAPPLALAPLAAMGRALRAMDRSELTRAWHELKGQRDDDTELLRREIAEAGRADGTRMSERARLMAARGDPDAAWVLLAKRAEGQLNSPRPDAAVLLAAADVQLARGLSTDAGRYYARSIAADPKRADAHIGLAQIQAVQQKPKQARQSLERAAQLDPESPRPLEALAALDSSDPGLRASAHLRAGKRHARGLGSEAARVHFGRAIRLDPKLEAGAEEESGAMLVKLGDSRGSAASYQRAIDVAGESSPRLRGLAEARRLQGQFGAAQARLERATELEPGDPNAHRDLARVYEQAGRAEDAIVSLRHAVTLAPGDARARGNLAQVLHDSGKQSEALELLLESESAYEASAGELRLAAEILRGRGENEAAARTLGRAIELRPADARLRVELAEVRTATGDEVDARAQRELAIALGGYDAPTQAGTLATKNAADTATPAGAAADPSTSMIALIPLVSSFSDGTRQLPKRVAFLGVRELLDERGLLLDWLSPKTPDIAGLERELAAAIQTQYELTPEVEVEAFASAALEKVFDFQQSISLDPSAIASVNLALATDAVFVAQLVRAPGGPAGYSAACGAAPFFEIELRRLSSDTESDVRALANVACLPGGIEARGIWNQKAAGIYGALLLGLLLLVRRGWGSVVVGLKLPPNTKALFSISVSRQQRRVKAHAAGKLPSSAGAKGRIERSLRSLDLRERSLRQGQPTIFRWVAARKRPYYVTVRGPLFDYLSDDLVGDFLEEKTVLVKRGERARIEFDMRPQECALHITVHADQTPYAQALVARRGDPASVRYTSQGSAFLYLEAGTHTIVAGAEDRVCERTVVIEDLDPKALPIDLGPEHGLLFAGCPDAVVPYLEGNYEVAADALEAAGAGEVVHTTRALGLEERGEFEAAGRELAAAGHELEAAELLLRAGEQGLAAELFEAAAEYARAGDCRREAGELAEAGRLYALDHRYDDALECLRETGDRAGVLELLEMNGNCFEAAEVAEELGDPQRAISNLQRVEPQLDCYVEACLRLATLYLERGETEGALERFDEAIRLAGAEEIPVSALHQHADLLERAGRLQDAMTIYERANAASQNDATSARMEVLRKKIQTEGPVTTGTLSGEARSAAAAPASSADGEAPASRYEILEELGRGGMGVVYKARDTRLGRIVALKKLTDNLQQHPTAIRYFEREARSAAALNHPNIVTVYDAGTENGSYFISMEFMEGTPLDGILESRGPLPARTVARLGLHVATGLDYAHRNKIIHRDIKTANLFFTNDKVVKIMDFGLAKMVEEVRRASTIIAGTPYYMSPEQSTGDNPDHRADLYSLGCTLFQLQTGRVPFTEGDVAYHHRHTPPPDPREFAPETPEQVALLILEMLQKEREDRVQSAAEIAQRFQQMLG
jgi:tetratricopeptide (TPR) repeat protein